VDLGPILATLPEWMVWDATAPEQVAERLAGVQLVLSNKVAIRAEHLHEASSIKYIGILATGTNNVDVPAAAALRVSVSNVRDYSTDSVVQHTLMLILALAGNLPSYASKATRSAWKDSPFFCYFGRPVVELKDKHLTIVGYGSQGKKLAALAQGLGMVVHIARRPGAESGAASSGDRLPLDELLPITDVLSVHCPLTEATTNLLNFDTIFKLKKGALVINCARGGLINEEALAAALASNHLGGAAVDVLTVEPPPAHHPLLQVDHPNFILTPHIAWGSLESRQRLIAEAAQNVSAFVKGERRNLVQG